MSCLGTGAAAGFDCDCCGAACAIGSRVRAKAPANIAVLNTRQDLFQLRTQNLTSIARTTKWHSDSSLCGFYKPVRNRGQLTVYKTTQPRVAAPLHRISIFKMRPSGKV